MSCKPEGVLFAFPPPRQPTTFPPTPPCACSALYPYIPLSRLVLFVSRLSFIYQAFLFRVPPPHLPIFSRTQRKKRYKSCPIWCLGSYSVILWCLQFSASYRASLPPMTRSENCPEVCFSRGCSVLTVATMPRSLYKMGKTLV